MSTVTAAVTLATSLAFVIPSAQTAPPWAAENLKGVTPSAAATTALAELDSSSFATRQAASQALLASSVSDSEVFVLLSRGDLTPEQHVRLLCVAQLRILEAPRPALGIQMGEPTGARNGVAVSGVLRGMPSDGVLKPGDRITHINDQSIATRGELTSIIQAMHPGDRVRLVVMRGTPEARVELELPLGSQKQMSTLSGGQGASRPTADSSREHLAQQLLESFSKPATVLPVERIP